jgi:acyl-CoA synthetase (AMP-forming)/AMP-acid ligase II
LSNYLFSSLLPAERDPEQICLIAPDGRTFSFGDIDRISARHASALVSCGTGKGDRVAVQVEKSPEAPFLYLGCIRSAEAPGKSGNWRDRAGRALARIIPRWTVLRPNRVRGEPT